MKTLCLLIAGALGASAALGQISNRVDHDLFAQAAVVLHVQWLKDSGADKYAWQQVRVLDVFKNTSRQTFSNTLAIAHYSWTNGIPRAMCTVYLERYNPAREDLWKLMGGSARMGVSHVEVPEDLHRKGLMLPALTAPATAVPARSDNRKQAP